MRVVQLRFVVTIVDVQPLIRVVRCPVVGCKLVWGVVQYCIVSLFPLVLLENMRFLCGNHGGVQHWFPSSLLSLGGTGT